MAATWLSCTFLREIGEYLHRLFNDNFTIDFVQHIGVISMITVINIFCCFAFLSHEAWLRYVEFHRRLQYNVTECLLSAVCWRLVGMLQQPIRPVTVTASCRWFTQPGSFVCVTKAKAWRVIRLCRPSLVAQSQRRTSTASRTLLMLNWCNLVQIPTLQSWQSASTVIQPTVLTLTRILSLWRLKTASHCWCVVTHGHLSHWAVFELASHQILHAPCHLHIRHLTASGMTTAKSLGSVVISCKQWGSFLFLFMVKPSNVIFHVKCILATV